jgi:hypothetical protein
MYELKRALNDTSDVYAELGAIVDEAEAAFDTEEDRQYIAERVVLRLIGVLNAWPESAGRGPVGSQGATTPLVELIGEVAYSEYQSAIDTQKPKLDAWARTLRGLRGAEFMAETASAINDFVVAQWRRRSVEYEHCRALSCWFESRRRWVEAGHAEECAGSTLYGLAFHNVWISQGHDRDAYPVRECTCGARAGSGKTGG